MYYICQNNSTIVYRYVGTCFKCVFKTKDLISNTQNRVINRFDIKWKTRIREFKIDN